MPPSLCETSLDGFLHLQVIVEPGKTVDKGIASDHDPEDLWVNSSRSRARNIGKELIRAAVRASDVHCFAGPSKCTLGVQGAGEQEALFHLGTDSCIESSCCAEKIESVLSDSSSKSLSVNETKGKAEGKHRIGMADGVRHAKN